jgi:hypothetical protein
LSRVILNIILFTLFQTPEPYGRSKNYKVRSNFYHLQQTEAYLSPIPQIFIHCGFLGCMQQSLQQTQTEKSTKNPRREEI